LAMAGLANMLQSEGEYRSVACIEPDDACLEKLVAAQPDALLIQNEVLPQPIEEFVHKVRHRVPEARILLFGTAMNNDSLYSLARAGVHGYVSERADPEHIRRALGQVLQGNSWFGRHILERFVANQQRSDQRLEAEFNARVEQLSEQLTRRELEILGEVVKGLAIKQIAEQVHLSHQGVKMHLAKLFKKFNVSNRNQLILAVFDEISPLEDLSVMLQNGLNAQLLKKYRRNGQ
jgi:DNA-binding NarL/FixJ family response regulator